MRFNEQFIVLSILVCISTMNITVLYGQEVIKAIKAESEIMIDGNLDEQVWKTKPIIRDFISFIPLEGLPMPQKTSVWAAYDDENLYFAFYCYDTDPEKIKTSIRQRDNMWSDDWAGIAIDTIGNRQSLYRLFVNPSGIQGDMIDLLSSETDTSVDWVWYSGGQIVDGGYTIEFKIPLRNIRFTSGKNVELGVVFSRFIAREGMEGCWPELPAGQRFQNITQTILYEELKNQSKIEILPSFTSSSLWTRQTPETWSSADTANEFGITAKYGITSSITLEATYNPDFSQVESDSFQIQVNRRYPIFYTEKRPFFMEAGNHFNVAGTQGEGNMTTALHTRKIVDPEWGARLTAESGNMMFAVLAAGDEFPGRVIEGEENSYLGKNANYMLGRMKLSLGGENYIGVIYSGKEMSDYHNRVIGADFNFKLGDHNFVWGNALYTETNNPDEGREYSGGSFHIKWSYESKPLNAFLMIENYDKDFQMDTAFYERTGITNIYYYFCPMLYPEETISWIRRIRIFTWGFYTYDWNTDKKDYFTQLVIHPTLAWDGWFRLDINLWGETWEGETYDKVFYRFWMGQQFTNWLYFYTYLRIGNSIYYDKDDPFMGDYLQWRNEINLQPTDNFNQYFYYEYEKLDYPETGERAYDVHILQSKTTYQFDEHLSLRALIQYDSYREVVLTDILASFTLIPGSVVYLGYGSLHENLNWNNSSTETSNVINKYYQTSQSLFLKISYLFQL